MSGLFFLSHFNLFLFIPFSLFFIFNMYIDPFFCVQLLSLFPFMCTQPMHRHFILMLILIKQMKLRSKSMSSELQMSGTALRNTAGGAAEAAKASGMSAESRSHFSRRAETLGRRRSDTFLSFRQLLSTDFHIYFLLFVN